MDTTSILFDPLEREVRAELEVPHLEGEVYHSKL